MAEDACVEERLVPRGTLCTSPASEGLGLLISSPAHIDMMSPLNLSMHESIVRHADVAYFFRKCLDVISSMAVFCVGVYCRAGA